MLKTFGGTSAGKPQLLASSELLECQEQIRQVHQGKRVETFRSGKLESRIAVFPNEQIRCTTVFLLSEFQMHQFGPLGLEVASIHGNDVPLRASESLNKPWIGLGVNAD